MDTEVKEIISQHAEQSIFIQNFFSSNGDKIRNMNQHNEDSFWSETQSAQMNQNRKDTANNLNHDKCDIINTNEQMQNDKSNTFTISSYQKSCEDFQQSKSDKKKFNMNSLQVQNILQTNCFLQDLKGRNSQVFQNDQESKIENLDKVSVSQSLKFFQLFGFENNTYVGTTTNHKNQNSTTLQNKRDVFLKNLALLAKIKIQTTHYYKKFTNIYRTRLLNTQTRKIIQDLSDFIPEKTHFCLDFVLEILEKSQCLTLFDIYYFISSACAIIYQMNKQDLKKSTEVVYLHKQLAQKNISNEFKMTINQYLDSYYKNADNLIYQLKIYQILPRELREQLTLQMNIQLIKNIKCICTTYSLQTLEKLSLNCIDEIYLPDQIISTQSQDDYYLFYIQEGQVEILNSNCKTQKTQIPYEVLQRGDVFGEVGFFTGIDANYFIKCIKTTKVLKIKRSDFVKIIKNNNEEFQKFCQTKDQILLYNDFKDIQLKCKFCQKFTHLTKDCQLINLNQKQFLHRIKINEQKIQQRRNIKRKLLFHHNSLNNLSINQMLAFKYQFNNDHENLKDMDLVEYLQYSWSQNEQQDISQYQQQINEAQDYYFEEYFQQKELEACNKTYGSYLKSEILSQQAKKRSSIQSTKIAQLSTHEIDDQQAHEKKFNKMGTLDRPNLQQIEPSQHIVMKENSKYENQKSQMDLDGIKKCKEIINESPQVEQNDEVLTNTKASQHIRQTKNNSLSKIFLEVDNHSEYGWLSQKKKPQQELINKNIELQKQSNLNSPCGLSRRATNKNTFVQIINDQTVFTNYYYWQFDKLKNYQNYYASGNSNLVLEQLNNLIYKNKKNSKLKKL
ncbi:hypothetical protein ABPG73_009907 [Tetrahymena malaccensis]